MCNFRVRYEADEVPSPFAYYPSTGRVIGGEWEFIELASSVYGVQCDVEPSVLQSHARDGMADATEVEQQRNTLASLRGKRALLLVDIQNDFCEGGSLEVPHGSEVVDVANRLRAECHWDVVVLTQDFHPPDHVSFASNNDDAEPFSVRDLPGIGEQTMWPDHCVQGTPGCAFHPYLDRREDDVVVRKGKFREVDSYSGFGDASEGHVREKTELEDVLRERGIETVFICGLAADVCVAFTAKDSAKAGFQTFVVQDGCRGLSKEGVEAQFKECAEFGVRFVQSSAVPRPAVEEQWRREQVH